jgi:hypothetical protein
VSFANNSDDRVLDPDGRYPVFDPRLVDRVAMRVHHLLPTAEVARTRDVYEFIDEHVVVLVTPDVVEARLPTVKWAGPHSPVPCSLPAKRMKLSRAESGEALEALIADVRTRRQQEIRPCDVCGRPTEPEHAHRMFGKYVCHGCAEREFHIVH